MIYLAGGLVIHEGTSSDTREAGSFIGELLFTNETEAVNYANGVISDLIECGDGAKIAKYADKEVKKCDDFQFDDVWVRYPDGETVKVCVWVFDDFEDAILLTKPQITSKENSGLCIEFEDENGMVCSAVFDGQEGNYAYTNDKKVAETLLKRAYYPENIKILQFYSISKKGE